MTFREFIKAIKDGGNIKGAQGAFVADLFNDSFETIEANSDVTEDAAKKWLQRDNSAVNSWVSKEIKKGTTFDHVSFIRFLSSRTTTTWTVVQKAFSDMDESERLLIDCKTNDASVFWCSVLLQFKGIVGLAQDEDDIPAYEPYKESVKFENLPSYVSAPFLFSPISTNRHNSSPVYRCAYTDKSTVVMSGRFENGRYLVLSYGKIFAEHLNSSNDVQGDLVEALYSLLTAIGNEYPHKRIGISCGHDEQVTAAGFNRTIKSRFLRDGISVSDTAVAAIELCDVFIIGEPLLAFSEDDEDAILAYIANGGAVVFCSNGWKLKKSESGEQNEIELSPVTRFGKMLGFKIERNLTGKLINISGKRLYFTPLQCALNPASENKYPDELTDLAALANAGDANAQWQLGLKYESGDGWPKDSLMAMYWYKMAAFQGNADGQHRLSRCYMGTVIQGVNQNNALVLAWLTSSAEQRNKYAQGNLGHAYQLGLYGLEPDYKKAIAWTEASAKNGWAVSQIRFGKYCENIKDFRNAALWYMRAINTGQIAADDMAEAKLCLSLLFLSGNGVSRDVKKAALLLQESAALGNNKAASELEMLAHQLGSGATEDSPDDNNTKYYDVNIFDGTKYAELNEGEKQDLLKAMSAALEIRIGERIAEYVGEELIAEFDRIPNDTDFVDSEVERLDVKQSYLYRANRLCLPSSVSDIEIARDIFPAFWMQQNCPDYVSIIDEQRMALLHDLLNGTLDLYEQQ
jgi:TPR repeat protein